MKIYIYVTNQNIQKYIYVCSVHVFVSKMKICKVYVYKSNKSSISEVGICKLLYLDYLKCQVYVYIKI